MSKDYNISTRSNVPETFSELIGDFSELIGEIFGILANPLSYNMSETYKTTITDSSDNVVATGSGSTASASQDDAYTNLK